MRIVYATLRRWALPVAIIAAGIVAIAFWPRGDRSQAGGGGIWSCSMHPQVRMDHFDVCPICGMDLTPVGQAADAGEFDPEQMQLGEHARQMARVETASIEPRLLFREIRTVGKIDFDETRMAQIASRVNGRVDQVFADFPGTVVKQGDHLVKIYSPDLVSTQEEYLAATRREQRIEGAPTGIASLAASARRRLALWGISEEQLEQILASGKAETHLVVYAPLGGTVVEKMVRAGQYVREGETLYAIADLSHVWLIVEVYETDLPWIRFGQAVQVAIEADPAASFMGQVGFIEPVLNEQTRTVRVRVILKNDDGKLKPGMFAQALVRVAVMPDGTPAPTGLEGKFACPMHPYVLSDHEDTCRVCEMALEQIPGAPSPLTEPPVVLSVPADAVLTTGRRQLVYLETEPGAYRLVEPHLGPRTGDYYPVLHGLKAGDRVVTRGNFLLDSQFQISGRPSLLYPEGMSGGGGHDHGAHGAGATAPRPKQKTSDVVARNLARLSSEDNELALLQVTCPVTGEKLGSMGVPIKVDVEGQAVLLCCAGCVPMVRQNPAEILEKLAQPRPADEPAPQRPGKNKQGQHKH